MTDKTSAMAQKTTTAGDGSAAALVYCRNLVVGRGSPLVQVAAALPAARQDLFYPAYAAMRIIDDFVDDDFLARPIDRRHSDRSAAKERVAIWRQQTEAASLGRHANIAADPQNAQVYEALRTTLGQGTLGPAPWQALAGAMLHDLSEHTLVTWDDFDTYAEGAAVAPAAIFIYILASDIGPACASITLRELSPQDHARDLAKYCYLVHILRDLGKDAQLDPQLITIPSQVLAACQLEKAGLTAAPRERIKPLADILLARASLHRAAAEEQVARLLPRLGPVEHAALSGLIRLYDEQHAKNRDLYADAPVQ